MVSRCRREPASVKKCFSSAFLRLTACTCWQGGEGAGLGQKGGDNGVEWRKDEGYQKRFI